MFTLLLTVFALALPFFVYRKYLASKTPPLEAYNTKEPLEIDASEPSGSDSELDLPEFETKAPATEPDNASTEVSLRGDPAVQPQSPVTGRQAPAALPADETTDITPHERRMLDAMTSYSSEHFQHIRQSMSTFLTSNASIQLSA
ncbi:hypothetical protein B0H12DRAFT_442585 [Mycena haematopus]|nr:hypothetical protein B0H12DRAFT_442585 [Mycena haematopus]